MKYFGTDGFRGEANVTLNVDHAFKIGKFLGWHFSARQNKPAKIIIGKDTRRSSYMFEYALAAGITSSGSDAYLLHVTTTPNVSYTTRTEDFDCGIMITASHNPFFDNGIKIINSMGHKMEEELLDELEQYLDDKSDKIPLAQRERIGRTVDYFLGRNRYIGYLISTVTASFKDKRIGLDCANGSSFEIAKNIFDALGAKTYVINNEPDGFNINLESGSTHIKYLQDFVIKNKLDAGFAFDGDADRCIAVDNEGKIIDGDLILYICGTYFKDNDMLTGNTIVTTIMSNLGLFKALDKYDIKYEQTSVGDKYVFQSMVENGYFLGGEQSGHIIFSKYGTGGDGIMTALRLMEIILKRKTDFASLVKNVTLYPQILLNVKVKSKIETMENCEVKKTIINIEKNLGNSGRVLVRESGTEPVIRIMIEADKESLCKYYANQILDIMKNENLTI